MIKNTVVAIEKREHGRDCADAAFKFELVRSHSSKGKKGHVDTMQSAICPTRPRNY